MERDSLLFVKGHLSATLEHVQKRMYDEMRKLDEKYLVDTDAQDLAMHFTQKFSVEPLQLAPKEKARLSKSQTQVDVSGDRQRSFSRPGPFYVDATVLTWTVQFSGDAMLLDCQPNTFDFNPPRASVHGNRLSISVTTNSSPATPDDIKRADARYKRIYDDINKYIEWQQPVLTQHNHGLYGKAYIALLERQAAIKKQDDELSALGYATADGDQPSSFPVKRRIRVAKLPPLESRGPDTPIIEMKHYEDILIDLRKMGESFERTPQTYAGHGEEDFRNVLLGMLNTNYEFTSGETFNRGGKTDILIRQGDRNLFIAECKIWHGESEFLKAIDQLLRYVTWRDTKTSVLLFSRNKNFSDVLNTVTESIKKHPNFVSESKPQEPGNNRYLMNHPDDAKREILMTVLCFSIIE